MWGFAKRSPRSLEVTPKHEELFRDADNIAESITRETSQNSADARADDTGGVKVRITRRALPASKFAKSWLPGFLDHVRSWKPDLASAIENSSEVECLVIEDFGTKGLTGEIDKPGGGFYAFWRQYGKSSKRGNTGGRHGEGKSTLAGASLARMFFGLTIRDDRRILLMGQTILGPHDLEGEKYDAYGEFSPTEGESFPEPFENRREVTDFMNDFGLSRTDESGLSLVVPFARPEILENDLDSVKQALVVNCFPQIASGLLTFDVEGELLDATTLADWEGRWPKLRLRGAIAVATEAVRQTTFFEAASGDELSNASFSEEDVERMRQAFADGELVSVRLPIAVRPKSGPEQIGTALLHLRKATEGEHSSEHYARSRLTVPKQRRVLAGGDLVGLLLAEDGPLSDFLGDAEPPSHARWTHQNLRDVDKYRNTQSTLSKVANSLRQLERVLRDEDAESVNREAFKSLFSRPKPKPERVVEKGATKPLDLPPARPFWTVERRTGGFAVRRPESVELVDVVVEAAYVQRRGPPNWKETDFVFGGDVKIKQSGHAVVDCSDNRIRVRGADANLMIEADGFDPHRDLVVTVRAMEVEDVEA